MTDVCGFRCCPGTLAILPTFRKQTVITASNVVIRPLVIWFHATWPRARQRNGVRWITESATLNCLSIWISKMPSPGTERMLCAKNTATCFTCTRRSRGRTPMNCPCEFVLPFIIRRGSVGRLQSREQRTRTVCSGKSQHP